LGEGQPAPEHQSFTNGPICLVVSIVSTHLKNMVVKLLEIFPEFRSENKKMFELPPARNCLQPKTVRNLWKKNTSLDFNWMFFFESIPSSMGTQNLHF